MKTKTREPVHPGRIIKKDYIEPLNLSITKLAEHLNVSRQTVSKLINEKTVVSTDMAIRLSIVFDTTPTFWLNLQRSYNMWNIVNNSSEWKSAKPIPKTW